MGILETLRNAWKIADLRKKIIYTLFIILLFRVGSSIPVPFINAEALEVYFSSQGSLLGYLNMLSGNALTEGTIFALTIQPYINASIIIQLLTIAIPALERLSKDGGEEGRKKINQITRYVTVGIALIQAFGYLVTLKSTANGVAALTPVAGFPGFLQQLAIVLVLVAGSCLVMWLGESINEKGIGNGISMLLFAGILSSIPSGALVLWERFYTMGIASLEQNQGQALWMMISTVLVLVLFLAMIGFIVFMTDAERRIPIQYAKKVVGRKMYGGQNTHMPIKVNMSGVMPIILAVSILSLPSILVTFLGEPAPGGFWAAIVGMFQQDSWVYIILYALMIIGFAFFYVTIQYNPTEMANNLRKNGGAIPGQRPGKPTADFIKRVLNKVTFIGALFLGVVALFPSVFGKVSNFAGLTIGGTSLMIVVGVALETVQQIESQMMMRHYKGFLD